MPYLTAALAAVLALPAAPAETLDEITVVATRRPTEVGDVSLAVTSQNRDAVQAEKLVTDALDTLPGVSLQQTTPGQGAAIVRGLKGSAILHLVDGMRLSNAMFRTAPTPWFALVPASAVERLEVVRGTPASLYGSEAVGGVIQAVTHLPEFESDTTESRGEFVAGFDTAELLRSVRATFDAGNRDLAWSLSAEYLQTDDRKVGGGERVGPSDFSAAAFRTVVRGVPDERRSWFVDLHYLDQPETPRVDELVPGFGQVEPSSAEFVFAPNQRVFAHAQYEFLSGLSGLDWKLDAAWQRIDDDRITRDLNASERRFERNRSDLYGLTLNVSGSGSGIDWIAGIDTYYDEVRSSRIEQDVAGGPISSLAPRFPDGSTISQGGLFANAQWQPADRHTINGGLRFSEIRIELPDGTRISPGRLSGDLGWVFDVSDSLQVVANFGSGFRAPNIADLGTLGNRPGNRFNIPNSNLGAEEVSHGDLGMRFGVDTWRAEVHVFAMRYTDRIVSVSTGDVTPDGRDVVQSVNAATSSLHGVEAGIEINLSRQIRLSGIVNYTRGEQDSGAGDEPADRVPPLHGRMSLHFDRNESWSFETWLAAASGQDRLSARDVRDSRIDPNGTPGWASLGGKVVWSDAHWQVGLGVDNVFDRRYRKHGSGIDVPGRNVFLTMRRRW